MRLSLICVALLAGLAGCVSMGGRLESSADDLEERTDRFYNELRRDGSVRDAAALAEAADDFHRVVESGGSREDIDVEFERLARHYHDLREGYDPARADPEERERFEEITTAYLEVEGALKYR